MLSEISESIRDAGVLRRLVFASTHLPKDCPQYWDIVARFSTKGSKCTQPSLDKIKALVENIEDVSADAFATDNDLLHELHKQEVQGKALGVVLLSPQTKCKRCGGKLRIKAD